MIVNAYIGKGNKLPIGNKKLGMFYDTHHLLNMA